jgi:hypothetical protein
MSTQENASKLRELVNKYPDKLKVLRSPADIEQFLDMDAVMKAGQSGLNFFKNDDSTWPDFISRQLTLGKDVAVQAGSTDSILVYVGNGLFKKSRW